MNEQLVQEHNRLFKQALSIVEGKLSSQGQPDMPVPGWLLSRNFKHAIALFERVLEINPGNWSAMWFMGKVHQRLRNNAEAFSWFERAYHVNPSHPDIAREASISAMEIGSHDSAIVFANRATQIG